MTRVLLVTDAYPPLRTSAAVQMRDLAREFVARGCQPVIVTPDSRLQGSWKIEKQDGVDVLRVRSLPTKDVNYVVRAIAEALLPWLMIRAIRRSPLRDVRWDGVVAYSPTTFFGPILRSVKRRSGCRAYLIQRDMFPDWAVDVGVMRRGAAYHVFKRIERQQYEAADVVGVQAPSNAPYVTGLARSSVPRVEVLWNWLAREQDRGCSIDFGDPRLSGRTIFVYAGNMGVAQEADAFLDVARHLLDRKDVVFLLVGRGSALPALRARAEAEGLGNVVFHDEIDPREIPGLLAGSHVGLLALNLRHRTHNIPGKFLAYTHAGLPILARINPNNDLARLIEQEGVGLVCTEESTDRLAQLAGALADDREGRQQMANRGRELAQRLFSPERAVSQILEALRRPVGG